MIKKYFFVFFFYALSFLVLIAEDKPVVIALPPFCDFSQTDPVSIISLRDKVTANLLQNYNCVILSRSNGLVLASEHKLNIMNQLDAENNATFSLPSADYALVGYFRIERRIPGNTWKVELNCTLLVTDLNKNKAYNFKNIPFIPDKSDLYANSVTKAIVKALGLKPKKKKYKKWQGKVNETWAVLPIKRLESKETIHKPADRDLAVNMELSLQESGKLKRIVDHNEIDKILQELKILSLNDATESVAGGIAKLVGADKIIMGSVSKVNLKGETLQVTLFLVDGKSGVILDSATAITLPKHLNKTAADLVLNFTHKIHSFPELVNADQGVLEKEAAFYTEMAFATANNIIDPIYKTKNMRNYAELIYLLANKNDWLRYKAVYILVLFVNKQNIKEKKEIGEIIKLLLKNTRRFNRTYYYLYLANIWANDTATLDEKIATAEQYLKQFPRRSPKFQSHVIGTYYFEKKDFKTALEYAKNAKDPNFGKSLLPKVYKALGGTENNRKELALRKTMHFDYPRCIELMRKFEGPDQTLAHLAVARNIPAWGGILGPEYMLELAKVYLGVGDKAMAGMVLDNFYDNVYYPAQKSPRENETLRKEYECLIEKTGQKTGTWKSIADIIGNSHKYKIYIQPLGKVDIPLIKRAIIIAEELLGFKIEILPPIPLPEDPYCFEIIFARYRISHCLYRINREREIPADAILVINITEKSIWDDAGARISTIISGMASGESYISYNLFARGLGDDYSMQNKLVKMLAKSIGTRFCRLMEIQSGIHPRCLVPRCIGSVEIWPSQVYNKRFAICTKCQEYFSKTPIDSLHKAFRRTFDRKPRIFRKDRKEYQDLYASILRKTLAEAKKRADEEAKKPLNYLTALTFDKEPLKGLSYKYYEFEPGVCKSTEDLKKLTPKETGITDIFNQTKAKRDKNYGLIFEGLIKIPHDGKYRFYSSSYAGSRLWIGNKELINNDGIHAIWTKSAGIALKAGYHPIKLSFIQEKTEEQLALYYHGPETLGQKIPEEVLFYKK